MSDRWLRAWFEKDAATVDRLMADDYVYVAPNGSVWDRETTLGVIRSPSYRLDHATRTEVSVRAIGQGAAVLRHHYQGSGTFEGSSFTDDQQCVVVCELGTGGWRIVMEQCCARSPT
jgi:hypothetical protein